jgi:hypothetical protein
MPQLVLDTKVQTVTVKESQEEPTAVLEYALELQPLTPQMLCVMNIRLDVSQVERDVSLHHCQPAALMLEMPPHVLDTMVLMEFVKEMLQEQHAEEETVQMPHHHQILMHFVLLTKLDV